MLRLANLVIDHVSKALEDPACKIVDGMTRNVIEGALQSPAAEQGAIRQEVQCLENKLVGKMTEGINRLLTLDLHSLEADVSLVKTYKITALPPVVISYAMVLYVNCVEQVAHAASWEDLSVKQVVAGSAYVFSVAAMVPMYVDQETVVALV